MLTLCVVCGESCTRSPALTSPLVADAGAADAEEVSPEFKSRWMALVFAGMVMWRFPATTSTSRGGSTARSVVAAKGASAAAGGGELGALRSRGGGAGGVGGGTAAMLLLLLLLRSAASWTSPVAGNQKSQSFKTTATSATSSTPSAMSIRFRCTSTSSDPGGKGSCVDRSRWFSVWISS